MLHVTVLALHALTGKCLSMNVPDQRAIGDGLADELLILMAVEHDPSHTARGTHLVDLQVDLLLHCFAHVSCSKGMSRHSPGCLTYGRPYSS